MNVGSGDISSKLNVAEVVVHDILHNGSDLILAQLLVIHQAFDMTDGSRPRCRQDIHIHRIIEILKSLGEDTDLPRLDHLGGGIKQGGGCSPLGPHPDPVSRIQAPLPGINDIEHDFMLTYLYVKGSN